MSSCWPESEQSGILPHQVLESDRSPHRGLLFPGEERSRALHRHRIVRNFVEPLARRRTGIAGPIVVPGAIPVSCGSGGPTQSPIANESLCSVEERSKTWRIFVVPTVSESDLLQFSEQLLLAGGALPHEARIVARSLVDANLLGYDSHGVMRLPQYITSIQQGEIRPGNGLTIVNETPALTVADGGWGFGQVLAQDLCDRLIEQARAVGVGCGTLRHSSHIGRLGEYAERGAQAGMLSLIFANNHGGAQRVAPVGGIRPRLGTNPLCLGCPGGEEGPFVLDFCTSATAEGKVRVAKIAGQPVPEGWLLDADGEPTTDPNAIYENPPGTILPMGGIQGYKGFGLAFMLELFCSGLSGAPVASESPSGPRGNAAFFLFVSPEQTAGRQHLAEEAKALERYIRSVPRRPDVMGITLPGDPERTMRDERVRDGLIFDAGNWSALVDLADALQVAVPAT